MARSILFVISLALILPSCHGRVLELDERFSEAKSNGEWLIMFYAPWCGHCKQLEPTWIEVGDLMEEILPVHVARLDCTRYSSLSSSFGVRGFPTIKYISGDIEYEYQGPRTKRDIIDFTRKARGPKVTTLRDISELETIRNKEAVSFLYVGDEDTDLRKTYEKVATKLFLSISFNAIATGEFPSVANHPSVVVFKDGTFHEMPVAAGARNLLTWIASEQTPDYSELTGISYHSLKNTGKLLSVAVLPETGDEHLKNAAKSLALSRSDTFRPKFVFSWVKGNAIINKMTYATIKTPNFVVFNANNYEYFVLNGDDDTGAIGSDELNSFLTKVLDGKLTPLGGSGFFKQIGRFFVDSTGMIINFFKENPIIASLVFGVPTFLISFLCYCLCTMEEGSMEEDDDYSDEEEYEENVERPPEYGEEEGADTLRRRHPGSGEGEESGGNANEALQDAEDESQKDK